MPGFGAECMSGAHAQCSERFGECRCPCHTHTQELMRKGTAKSDKRGGFKRRGKTSDAALVIPIPMQQAEQPEIEIHNTCPKCHTRAKTTDQFCRKDGTRLCLGKPCVRCESPCDEQDEFCWQCGWKLADPLPMQETTLPPPPSLPSNGQQSNAPRPSQNPGDIEVVSAAEAPTAEDPYVRLKRIAQEQGLLRPATPAS